MTTPDPAIVVGDVSDDPDDDDLPPEPDTDGPIPDVKTDPAVE